MDYSADGKILFISPIVLPILWFLGSPCKKGEDGGNQAVSKGNRREGQSNFDELSH
jgi:hypothetical protein